MACGACCAFFSVSFYWAEAGDAGGTVPARLTYNSKIREIAFTYNVSRLPIINSVKMYE
ncbi:ferredoxin [Escherichia coli E22]|nr:ferredoxin [Escherichia coli E22]